MPSVFSWTVLLPMACLYDSLLLTKHVECDTNHVLSLLRSDVILHNGRYEAQLRLEVSLENGQSSDKIVNCSSTIPNGNTSWSEQGLLLCAMCRVAHVTCDQRAAFYSLSRTSCARTEIEIFEGGALAPKAPPPPHAYPPEKERERESRDLPVRHGARALAHIMVKRSSGNFLAIVTFAFEHAH